MKHPQHTPPPEMILILLLVMINTLIIKTGFTEDPAWYRVMFVTIPLLLIVIANSFQKEVS